MVLGDVVVEEFPDSLYSPSVGGCAPDADLDPDDSDVIIEDDVEATQVDTPKPSLEAPVGEVATSTPPVVAKQPAFNPALMPPPPDLSHGAKDRRIRRALEPNARGEYKVSEEIRKLWEEGKKDTVFRLFAECGNNTDVFVKTYSVKKDHEREMEVGVYFTFFASPQVSHFIAAGVCWSHPIDCADLTYINYMFYYLHLRQMFFMCIIYMMYHVLYIVFPFASQGRSERTSSPGPKPTPRK